MIYLKTVIAGMLGVAVVIIMFSITSRLRRNPPPRPMTHSRVFWALVLLCFALWAGLYWEFHGIVFYVGHVAN